MRIFASGCIAAIAALIVAFGTPTASAAPSTARQTSAPIDLSAQKNTAVRTSTTRHVRSVRRSSRQALRPTRSKGKAVASKQARKTQVEKTAEATPGTDQPKDQAKALSASLANAHAEMIAGEPAAETAPAGPTAETTTLVNESAVVVASDQINDIDRAAMTTPRVRTVNASFEIRDETDFSQTSLIGRIFIAIGALLTIGSAVRMVMN